MSTLKPTLIVAAALLWLAASPALAQAADRQAEAAKLIGVLKSNASQKEKFDACRQLALVGGKDAIAPLAAWLPDEQMNHMARYGLETIPDPGVEAAFRAALPTLKGRQLAGVIGSLGSRHDPQAVPALIEYLTNADDDVAQAAARALGKIATPPAAKALKAALPKASAANRLAFCEGAFRCAEAAAAQDDRKTALGLYETLRALPEAPHQVRAGALRGTILSMGKAGAKLIEVNLLGNDYILAAAAARTAMEMPGPEVTKTLSDVLPKVSGDKKVLVIQTIGRRADAASLPGLFAAAKTGAKAERLAAVRAIPEFGTPATVPVLVELLTDADKEIAQAAQEGLASTKGAGAEDAIKNMLGNNDAAWRLKGVELIGRRRMADCVPALLKASGDADGRVRSAALKRLGDLAAPAQWASLVELLGRVKESDDLDALEQSLIAVSARAEKPEAGVSQLVAALGSAAPAQKVVIIHALNSIGGADALKAVLGAVKDADGAVHTEAIRALGTWKTTEAAPHLLALAQDNGASATDRTLCLRSYLGLAANPDLPADQRLRMVRDGASLVKQTEEQKLMLAALGSIPLIEALDPILPLLEVAAVKDEAGAAAVAITDRLMQGDQASANAPKLVEPLTKVAGAVGNADLAKRANALLEKAKKGGK